MAFFRGESLFRQNFAGGLLRTAKEMGANAAMESMGFAKYETIASILPYLKVYPMDIKHINPSKYVEYIGKSNKLMLQNAGRIAFCNTNTADYSCTGYSRL